jgi:uncharacterized protein YlxP (DUF503 family)
MPKVLWRVTMHVAALEIDLHLPDSGSLKEKRSVVRHLLDTSRQRFSVSASEVDLQDLRQRAVLGFAVVAPSAARVDEVLDRVERFVWSDPRVAVLSAARHWLDLDP